jgi:hypothetical protein
MQESITLGISGPDCREKKAELVKIANERGMSVSRFILWLFDQYKKRQERKAHALAR